MPVFDSTLLARFFAQGENTFSDEVPFLVDRVSLNIQLNTSSYDLPDYVRSIKRVTYQGMKLDPLPRRSQRDIFENATQVGKPFWYVFNNVGLNKIQLFPIPNQAIAPVADVWASGIPTGCIVEFSRITDNSTFVLPSYIKRQLLKQYVAMKCFGVDGAGLDLKLNKYFAARWQRRRDEFIALLDELHSKPRKLILAGHANPNFFPGQPVLPIAEFGISVDEGE